MRLMLSLACALWLASCTYLTPHRIEIQQGNLVTKESFGNVKLGMSKAEVRAVLGTPLLQDAFHASRWDYYFSHERPGAFGLFGGPAEQRKLTLFFENDKLAKIEGDVSKLPSDQPVEKK
jgi:outer membrane protein assembly factor BamE